jgi:hypothetical protein
VESYPYRWVQLLKAIRPYSLIRYEDIDWMLTLWEGRSDRNWLVETLEARKEARRLLKEEKALSVG